MSGHYDLVVAGGGLAGAVLAKALAERGARVLVAERETTFTDRARGEGMHPWGVAEARALGIHELLLGTCARELRWWSASTDGAPPVEPRDLLATTPHGAGELVFHHPEMQEVLLRAAAAAGAEVRRGASVVGLMTGDRPAVSVRSDGADETVHCRLVVGADGRGSRVRAWAGFPVARGREWLLTTSVLLRGVRLPDDGVRTVRHTPTGQLVLFFPLGAGRFRVYLAARQDGPTGRLSGARHLRRLLGACIETGAPPDWLAGAEIAGPLATFDSTDVWAENPYRDGVALVGDAAAANDPNYGCGLSLTLRDVRVLRDLLLAHSDWTAAGRAYAAEHDRYYGSLRALTEWSAGVFYDVGPDADARRARVQQGMKQARAEGRLVPDVVGLGPDGPNGEEALRSLG